MSDLEYDDVPRGPEEHQEAARDFIVREPGKRPRAATAADLLALTTGADPFYCGTAGHVADGEWFAAVWAEHGRRGAHLRHIHYRLFTAGATRPNGTRYANDSTTWTFLVAAAARARYLGLVDPEEIVDQRNGDPAIGAWPRDSPAEPAAELSGDPVWPGLPSITAEAYSAYPSTGWVKVETTPGYPSSLPGVDVSGYSHQVADQPVLLEIWAEKSSVDDAVSPAGFGVNYVRGTGYLSITRIVGLLRRAQEHGKAAHVLYVSDYDPAGQNMPRQVARQLQFWRDKLGVTEQVTLHPIALTAEQVEQYKLPQAPDKVQVELDALIALHPGALERIIRDALDEWRDHGIEDLLAEIGDEAQDAADRQWDEATAPVATAIETLQAEAAGVIARHKERLGEVKQQIAGAAAPFRARLAALTQEINAATEPYRQQVEAVQAEAHAELAALRERLEQERARYDEIAEAFDPDLPDRPEAECTADRDELLYDSDRDWLEQLAEYRASKGLPPLEDGSLHGGAAVRWRQVYESLTSGNGSDGIGGLTDAERRELILALVNDGYPVTQIATMTGVTRGTVSRYCPPGYSTQVSHTCPQCGETFTGRRDAKFCNNRCKCAYYAAAALAGGDAA